MLGIDCTYGHVLEREESTVGVEEHVQVTRADESVVGVLNHALEHTVLSWTQALVIDSLVLSRIAEHAINTLIPVGRRGVDCFLNVRAVEVNLRTRRNVVTCVDLTKLGVGVRASLSDVVDVETWIYF